MTTTAIPNDAFTQSLQKIAQWIASGELPQAATALNVALKKQPKDPRVFMQGARLAEASGNPKGAEELARRALALSPGWVVSITELASLLARHNQLSEALTLAKKAVTLESSNLQVLSYAVEIAHQAQDFPQATTWLQRMAVLNPGNPQVKTLIARNLRIQGDNASAIAVYDELIAANPLHGDALLGRVQMAWMADDLATALPICETLCTVDPENEVFLFWRTLAQGLTPATMPVAMVKAMHDDQATQYDLHMVKNLKYQLPKTMAALIQARYPEPTYNLLDLGCGTGLLGLYLGKLEGAMVGVDVSLKMVEQLARHNLYDRVHNVNLLDALAETPDALYNVISACDVFGYVGDLTQAIPNACRILRPGGHLVFSCEVAGADEADWVLRKSLRYAHKRSHIEALCKAAGCNEVTVEDTVLFVENQQPVNGYIVVARKKMARKAPAKKAVAPESV